MANLVPRLQALRPTIETLMKIGGTPGLSLGLMHKGHQVYYEAYGFRDMGAHLLVTEDTVFPVCSMTKAVTSAAIGVLVDEGKVAWDTLVKDALPGFANQDETLQNQLTITDLLCHRAGMSWGDNLFIGTENNVLISGEDSMKYLNNQTRLLPFRGQFSYSNLPFELAGKVVEALSGQSFADFVRSRILDPLDMDRTFLKTPASTLENVAKCYNALDDGTVAQVTCVQCGDDWFGAAFSGMRSCMSDLMKLYKAFLSSFNDQSALGTNATKGSPLKQVRQLWSAEIAVAQPSKLESTYAKGWVRVQLPGKMGQVGLSSGLIDMPIVGKGVASQLVLYHQGSLPGALAVTILLPDTESAIVVQTNSLALNDVPDWVGQLVLEEFLEVPKSDRNDFVAAAHASKAKNLDWYPDLIKAFDKWPKKGTGPKDLQLYTGEYWDDIHVFKIDVTVEHGKLFWKFQGLESERFELSHFDGDFFTWLQPRNELSRRGRWVGTDQGPDFWRVDFRANGNGKIEQLFWVHDNDVPAVEYTKT